MDVVRYGIVRYGTVSWIMVSLPYRGVIASIFHFANRSRSLRIAECLINCDIVEVSRVNKIS